uniref:Uncharacterized protein n=1 Tax=Salix viminalis TaxID=40686 RepID=A0A6N2L4N9_SALVM
MNTNSSGRRALEFAGASWLKTLTTDGHTSVSLNTSYPSPVAPSPGCGVAVLVGVPNKDGEFKTRPMNILNEKTLKGTFFGNY